MGKHIDYDMMSILAGLTTRQRDYVINVGVKGLGASAAARQAGFTNPPTGKKIRDAIRQLHIRAAQHYEVELADIVQGYLDSIDVARVKGEPQSMIAGYRELARITGHLDSDKSATIGNQVNILQVTQEALENMSFAELTKLIPKEIKEMVLDGDHPRPESLALPDPASRPGNGQTTAATDLGDPPGA